MIVFDLSCDQSHGFEGWFRSASDYEDQKDSGLLTCPICGSTKISKAPMAPAIPAKGNRVQEPASACPVEGHFTNGPMPEEVAKAFQALAAAQQKALTESEWVGDRFAEDARAMHYGEADEKPIHGRASADEAKAMLEEGIAVAPLLVPYAPPDELN
ncbi:MAG: DUF1178 family protein [Sphingomonadaceae bacterium]